MSSDATAERGPATLVVGLGNPILGDDGVGWRVVQRLAARLADDDRARDEAGPIELDQVAVGGLSLMERLVGYERVVLVDAILGADPPGTVSVTSLADTACRRASHLDSAHDVPLTDALVVGRTLGARLPDDITVIGISVGRVDLFGEALTPEVEAAVEPATDAVLGALARRPAGVA